MNWSDEDPFVCDRKMIQCLQQLFWSSMLTLHFPPTQKLMFSNWFLNKLDMSIHPHKIMISSFYWRWFIRFLYVLLVTQFSLLVSDFWKVLIPLIISSHRCKKKFSWQFYKFHRETLVLEPLFKKVAGLVKKRLQHRCLSVNFWNF